jgi:glycine/D-amino acid oxidase-like deaminating enzyme
MRNYDVVIAGAGIIGLSIAWQLARRSELRILVLERGAGVGEGSTGASSAVCRCRYSLDDVVRLARDGIEAYRHWKAYTGLNSARAGLNEDGVLWLPGNATSWAETEHARMAELGVPTAVLDDAQLRERYPAINPCTHSPDFETGEPHTCSGGGRHFLELNGGWVDPVSAAQDLVDACRRQGVDIRFRARLKDVDVTGGKVTGVSVADGTTYQTPLLVNAAGPWCRELYAEAGVRLDWDLAPIRIQMLHRDRPPEIEGAVPVTVEMEGGVYFRTQNRGQQLLVGSVLEADEREELDDPDALPETVDDEFQMLKMHALHHRLPALPYRGRIMGYCGLYTVNRDDVHPILGPTRVDGFWVANGFSGHGFKLAPAIGSMVAQAITGLPAEFDTDLPLDFLGIDRDPIVLDAKSVLA